MIYRTRLALGHCAIIGMIFSFTMLPAAAFAEQFPSKPVSIIVPYSAGAPSDIMARRLADGMSPALGKPVLIQNVAGAGGLIGTRRAQTASPDGYTLVIGTQGTMMMNKFIYENLDYDPEVDFAPIVNLVSFPNLVLVPSSLGINSLEELVELANQRASEGSPLKYGSGGVGSSAHLAAELFSMDAGIKLTHIPYGSVADTTPDILSGRIDLIFGSIGAYSSHVTSGALVGLALTASARSDVLPDVPTIGEAGFPDSEFAVWLGLFAPSNTPEDVLNRLKEAAVTSMTVEATLDAFASEGAAVEATSPIGFAEFIQSDSAKWEPIIDALNIKLKN